MRQCDVLGAEFQLPLEGVSEAAQGAEVYMQAKAAQRADRPFRQACTASVQRLHCCGVLWPVGGCHWLTLCGCGPDACNFLPRKQVGAWWAMNNPCIWARLFRHATGELGLAAQMSEVGE